MVGLLASTRASSSTKKKVRKQIDNPFAVATAQAKKMGYKNFDEGGPGEKKRDEIAEAIKRK